MALRLVPCGRPVIHDGFCLVADGIENMFDRILSLLVCAIRAIEYFDVIKAFYEILEDALTFSDDLGAPMQRNEETA